MKVINGDIGKLIFDDVGDLVKIERDFCKQGLIFKDSDAFHNRPDDICYIPELSDYGYTANDLLDLCNGSKEVAEMVFECVNWQTPETYFQEQLIYGEVAFCNACEKFYLSYDVKYCPYCGEDKGDDDYEI